jgi:ABC-type glycerol-3-phosphate transport system substrate-binding protein
MMIKLAGLVALLALASGCAEVSRSDAADARVLDLTHGVHILVVKDPVQPVTCWISWSGTSCIPNRYLGDK